MFKNLEKTWKNYAMIFHELRQFSWFFATFFNIFEEIFRRNASKLMDKHENKFLKNYLITYDVARKFIQLFRMFSDF